MIRTKSLLILLSIFSIIIFSPGFSGASINAEGHDFGNVELGSTQKIFVSISNINVAAVTLGINFSEYSCNDFSIETSLPESITIPAYESINLEISYSPSSVGACSGTLFINTFDPLEQPNQVIFTGTGVEQEPEQPEPDIISQLLLEKLQKIIDYTNESFTYQSFRSTESDSLGEKRHKAFKKMLIVSYHLIENGHFEAAHNKLKEVCKKVDGKPDSNDFVPSEKATQLSIMLLELIDSFGFEDKQAKN